MTFIYNCTVLATDLRGIIVTIISYYKDGYIGTVIILVFNRIKKSADDCGFISRTNYNAVFLFYILRRKNF